MLFAITVYVQAHSFFILPVCITSKCVCTWGKYSMCMRVIWPVLPLWCDLITCDLCFWGLGGLWDKKNTMVSSCFKSLSSALLIGKSHRPYYKTNAAPSGLQGLWCMCVCACVCVIVGGRLIKYSRVDVWTCALCEWRWLFLIWNVCVVILHVTCTPCHGCGCRLLAVTSFYRL